MGIKALGQVEAEELLCVARGSMASLTQGLLITDASLPDNPIVYANPYFEQLTGYSSVEVVGQNCRFLQGLGTDPDTVASIRQSLATHQRFVSDILNYRKNGTPFWNNLAIGPLWPGAPPRYFVGLQIDVTAQRISPPVINDPLFEVRR